MAVPPNPLLLLGRSPGTKVQCCPDADDPDGDAWGGSPNTQEKCQDGTNTNGYHWTRQRSERAR